MSYLFEQVDSEAMFCNFTGFFCNWVWIIFNNNLAQGKRKVENIHFDWESHHSLLVTLFWNVRNGHLRPDWAVQLAECHPVHRKAAGSLSSQGTYPGCGLVPVGTRMEGNRLMFLFLPYPPFLSLKSITISSSEDFFLKKEIYICVGFLLLFIVYIISMLSIFYYST